MVTEIFSGSSGGGFGHGPPGLRQNEHKTLNAPDTGNEQGRHRSTESDFAEGSLQLVGKKRRRENEGSPRAGYSENDDNADPVNIEEETSPPHPMEDIIQQHHERVDDYTHQYMEVLETGKVYLPNSPTAFEAGILQLRRDIEKLENVEIVDEEITTRLCEARNALERLHAPASVDLAFEPEPCQKAHEQDAYGR